MGHQQWRRLVYALFRSPYQPWKRPWTGIGDLARGSRRENGPVTGRYNFTNYHAIDASTALILDLFARLIISPTCAFLRENEILKLALPIFFSFFYFFYYFRVLHAWITRPRIYFYEHNLEKREVRICCNAGKFAFHVFISLNSSMSYIQIIYNTIIHT